MRTPVLIVPGWGDSGPEHWQSLWEQANPDFRRVAQRDWLYPVRGEWVETLEHEIRTAGEPVVLVAHSLGCLAVAHCARDRTLRVHGALLGAPPDGERPALPPVRGGSARLRRAPPPLPPTLVASRNDNFSDFARSTALAKAWGSRLV